jgi:hypothetical protein
MQVKVATSGEARAVNLNVGKWSTHRKKDFAFADVKVAKALDRDRFLGEFLKRVFDYGKN